MNLLVLERPRAAMGSIQQMLDRRLITLDPEVIALCVPCPVCWADLDQPCKVRLAGGRVINRAMKHPHRGRRKRAERKLGRLVPGVRF